MKYIVLWTEDSDYNYRGYLSWTKKSFPSYREAIAFANGTYVLSRDFYTYVGFKDGDDLVILQHSSVLGMTLLPAIGTEDLLLNYDDAIVDHFTQALSRNTHA